MSNPSKNSIYYPVTSHTVVPAPTTMTGTIKTKGTNVTGVGTLFLSEVKPGDWIVHIAQDEVRKIVTRRDDLFLAIDSPFSSDMTLSTAFQVVRSRVKQMSLANSGAGDATIDGNPFMSGETVSFSKSGKNPNGSDFIDPVIVDATGTTVKVEILK